MVGKQRFVAGIGTGVALVVVVAAVVWWVVLRPQPVVPPDVQRAATFNLFVPNGQGIRVDSTTFRYDASQKSVAYTAYLASGQKIVIGEQATPEQFIDIPQTYAAFIDQSNSSATLDTSAGTVYIAKPGGVEAAIMNSKGTLFFARPNHSVSNDAWRQFFNALKIAN